MEFVLDVESDGPCPGKNSMISFGIVALNDFSINFKGTMAPISDIWLPDALAVSSITREQHEAYPSPKITMLKFQTWIKQFPENHKLWSDNIAYDWMWIHYYQHIYLGQSYFGHSGRRIGDLHAGFKRNIKDQSGYKKWRMTKHTHDPLDDAIGNAEALNHLKKLINAT